MSSWKPRGKYKRPRLLLQRHGHFDWQDWVIFAVVVATTLIVMMTYLPHRLEQRRAIADQVHAAAPEGAMAPFAIKCVKYARSAANTASCAFQRADPPARRLKPIMNCRISLCITTINGTAIGSASSTIQTQASFSMS